MADLLTVKSLPTDFVSHMSYCQPEASGNPIKCVDTKSPQKNKNSHNKKCTGLKKYAGILLMLTASFLYSVAMLMAKMLGNYGFSPMSLTFYRYFGMFVFSIPILIYYECFRTTKNNETTRVSGFSSIWPPNANNKRKILMFLLIRGLFGSTGILFRYFALKYLTIADTSVISFSSPIVVTIIAHFWLGEKCGVIPVLVTFTTLTGVIIILRPPMLTGAATFQTDIVIGTAFGVLSMLGSAGWMLITRKIRQIHFSIVMFTMGVIGTLEAFILAEIFNCLKFPTNFKETICVIALAILAYLGHSCTVLAIKVEQAGPVSLIRNSEIIFSFVLQFLCLGVIPDLYSGLGAVIVVSGVAVTAIRKWLMSLPVEDKKRQTCCILLR